MDFLFSVCGVSSVFLERSLQRCFQHRNHFFFFLSFLLAGRLLVRHWKPIIPESHVRAVSKVFFSLLLAGCEYVDTLLLLGPLCQTSHYSKIAPTSNAHCSTKQGVTSPNCKLQMYVLITHRTFKMSRYPPSPHTLPTLSLTS